MKMFFILIFFAAMHSLQAQQQVSFKKIDSLVVKWNQATIASLERQKVMSKDDNVKDYYNQRLLAFKMLVGNEDTGRSNDISLRGLFCNKLITKNRRKDFFIIENNITGAKNIYRILLIYKENSTCYFVELYTYLLEGWYQNKVIKITSHRLREPLSNLLVNLKKGFNKDDVIISHFVYDMNDMIKITSEYYLHTTLSWDSGIKQL
ncbi:hypothetical protein [Chitinophaga arvensicola]|uniref:DUF4468 domain-containing protein n=1 Tax=Chitinophaga arvensicola TaxID=29529 RepID=A0A1I0S769_9BACT|nr:hypothetical protein [Chitinophaga arvensicola]SEW51587.1 hypothetical protein SAMN04488122_4345 [Chitinophaga arvensicola]